MENRINRGHSKQKLMQDIHANSFTHRVAPFWNSLLEELESVITINHFKGGLNDLWKKHLMKLDHIKTVM